MKKILLFLALLIELACQASTHYISIGQQYADKTITNGDIVLFQKGGTYNPFVVANSNINIGSYGSGAAPIISGFTTVTGWTNEGGGIYSRVISGESTPNMLTIDGVQYAIGRYPNSTNLTFESSSTNTSITDNQLLSSPNWTGADVVIYKNGYTLDRCTITGHSGNTITYNSLGTTRNANATGEYFIQNDVRTLDQYGEWCYNSGKLSVYFGGINPISKTVKLSTIDNLIKNITGSDYITIDGISFEGSNSSSILFTSGTDNCTFKNCTISFSGYDALTLSGNSNLVDNNTISNCNGGGIVSNGTDATITNNTLTNIGSIAGQTNKIVNAIGMTLNGNNPLVQYNKVTNVGYMGIYLTSSNGTVLGTISNNLINHPCLVMFDSGGIYLGHNHTGTVINSNIVLNSGGNGIYLDEYCTGVTVSNNTVAYCSNNGIKLHKSNANTITGNVSFANLYGIIFENHVADEDNLYGNTVTGNKFIAKTASQNVLRFYNSYNSTAVGTLNNNYYARPVDDNLTFVTFLVSTSATKTLAQWQTFSSQDANSFGSPISVSFDSDIYFYYNPTKNDSTVVLAQPGIDVAGQAYSSPITLAPFTSIIILRDSSTGTYYYVSSSTGSDSNSGTESSPWASLTKVNSASLVAKDRVLFKSGDSWYGQLIPKSGSALGDIVYSSYGTGTNKPLIHASLIITGSSNWTNHSGSIWKNINQTVEICNLVFNNDRSFGKRKWSTGALTSQGDWYWDGTNKILYLYSGGKPSDLYQHIRTVNKLNLISASSKSYITIDGLALKYGDYGFVGSGTDHITIKNCDIAYIGGSDAGSPVRKGNGIEFWASNSNALVQNNKIWECFDAGITSQSSVVSTVISNMTFKNNQVWNCEYGYEYFNTGSGSSTSNILVENNTFYNSGAGWGNSQRSDPTGYSIRLANRTEATHSNFVIRNNIFSNSTAECQHNWDTTHNLYTINNNLYYQPTGNIVGINFTYYYTQAQFSTYKSVTGWDANSLTGSPKFIGKDVGDFRLLPISPVIGVGYQGRDIGAITFSKNFKVLIMNNKIYAL